jgi:hypothetical protein
MAELGLGRSDGRGFISLVIFWIVQIALLYSVLLLLRHETRFTHDVGLSCLLLPQSMAGISAWG